MASELTITAFDGARILFHASTWSLEASVRGRAMYFLSVRMEPGETYGTFKFCGYQWVWRATNEPERVITLYIARDLLMEQS